MTCVEEWTITAGLTEPDGIANGHAAVTVDGQSHPITDRLPHLLHDFNIDLYRLDADFDLQAGSPSALFLPRSRRSRRAHLSVWPGSAASPPLGRVARFQHLCCWWRNAGEQIRKRIALMG